MHALLDWPIYAEIFSSAQMRAVFSQDATIARWLEVETAIAAAQSELGMVPAEAASAIAGAAKPAAIDRERLAADTLLAGRPIVGLCNQLKEHLDERHRDWLHWGTTTQDVMDSASMLQVRDGLALLDEESAALATRLATLAEAHRETAMVGRTNGQHAQPLSFGLKLDVWVEELARRRAALAEAARRGLMLQLGGAVGSLAAYGGQGLALRRRIARRLGLSAPRVHWQNARDGIAEILAALGLLCASLEKIAREVNRLAGSDIAELSEGHRPGRGTSSAMAHKRNQRSSEFAEATARLGRQRAGAAPEIMQHEHERSGGAWIVEWASLPEVFLYASGALMWSRRLFEALEVHEAAMADNLAASRGLVYSERVTLALASRLGRAAARRLVERAAEAVRADGLTLRQALDREPHAWQGFEAEEIDSLFDPNRHLGPG